MNIDRIEALLKDNPQLFEKGYFSMKGMNDIQIQDVQQQLGYTLPNGFIWFLQTYGYGGCDFEILGYINHKAIFVEETIKYREQGMPLNFIMIENCDEYVYVLDCQDGFVGTWSAHDQKFVRMFDSFESYFLDHIENAIENLDE